MTQTQTHTHTHSRPLHAVLLTHPSAVDHAAAPHRLMCAADRRHTRVVMSRALRGASEDHTTAAAQLLVELLLEGVAQEVQGKRVEAGVAEGQEASDDTAHKVNQGNVHLVMEV